MRCRTWESEHLGAEVCGARVGETVRSGDSGVVTTSVPDLMVVLRSTDTSADTCSDFGMILVYMS